MKLEDLTIREQELYRCECPPERPCRNEDCAQFKAYYDALFAGQSKEEAEAAAVAALPATVNGKTVPARKWDGCKHMGAWTGRYCDEKT